MISKSKVSSKNQVTVPKAVMEALGMAPGDVVVFQTDGRRVTLRSKSSSLLEWVRSREESAITGGPITVEEMRVAVEEGAVSGEEGES